MKVKNKNSKKYLLGLAIIVFLCVSLFVINRGNSSRSTTLESDSPTSELNLQPATEEEKQASEENKKNLDDRLAQEQSSNTDATKKQVVPVISFADKNTVRAYVSGLFEEGGVCTATLTQNGQTVTKTSVGFQNASYTQCAPIDLSSSDLGSGTWTVIVSYTSDTAQGNSQPGTIQP